jgi:hypothetical protein
MKIAEDTTELAGAFFDYGVPVSDVKITSASRKCKAISPLVETHQQKHPKEGNDQVGGFFLFPLYSTSDLFVLTFIFEFNSFD